MTSPIHLHDQPAVAEGEVGEVASDRRLMDISIAGVGVGVEQILESKLTWGGQVLEVPALIGEGHLAPTRLRGALHGGIVAGVDYSLYIHPGGGVECGNGNHQTKSLRMV